MSNAKDDVLDIIPFDEDGDLSYLHDPIHWIDKSVLESLEDSLLKTDKFVLQNDLYYRDYLYCLLHNFEELHDVSSILGHNDEELFGFLLSSDFFKMKQLDDNRTEFTKIPKNSTLYTNLFEKIEELNLFV
ncbi:hypothetical protein [Oceanobacillus profundus]|uniref:Uncharacterized protein n=1 Tax=Oceanobacillus profundus TaxID=372463 RepID=A0A417YGR4_9BACI|nr:hypothetical protein [Oceanobacillus profundus]MBR2246137.1 hypothetical protein [Bacilli bacterium]MBR3119807.1 hypothetical protein [Oceanobacillus sp.]RHW31954.1 hypothetical protein D1B32_11995 [Oceanobacillus profundus]